MKYKVQVSNNHYSFFSYNSISRWSSYYYQIKAVLENKNKKNYSVLEIGKGDGVVSSILKSYGINIKTLDIDKSLRPDYLDSLPELKTQKNRKYDCIVCCEVLEHLKFEDVLKSIEKFSEIAEIIIISVPHNGIYFSFLFQFWYLKKTFLKVLLPGPRSFKTYQFNGEHYWELGTKGFNVSKFINSFNQFGLMTIKHFRIPEFLYHHMFIFKNTKKIL